MLKFLVAALLLSVVPAAANTITISGIDPGGEVSTYQQWYQRIADSGDTIEVDGACISACTILFSLPPDRVCMTERASFGFHMISGTDHDSDMTELYTRLQYPRWLLDMIAARGVLTEWPMFFYAEDFVDHIAMCPGHDVPTKRAYVAPPTDKDLPHA